MSGKKTSGKDTAAKVLIEKYGLTQYAFADPIKKACKIIFMLSGEQLNGKLKEVIDTRWNMTPREMYQFVGTELFRISLPEVCERFNEKIGNTIWITRFLLWYEDNKADIKGVVITDNRFFNELILVTNSFPDDTVSIKVERKGIDIDDEHTSETEIDSLCTNYTVHNDATIKDLSYAIESIYTWEKDKREEKQFNRKVEINKVLLEKKVMLETMVNDELKEIRNNGQTKNADSGPNR